ncbi:hypothetical protein ACQP08_11220 [Micromonospora zamorensis]|uniref:hypothetical protein n=1 Tax=Micromonospora zamorensis TaxID=709883 RepID=UPI003D91A6EA
MDPEGAPSPFSLDNQNIPPLLLGDPETAVRCQELLALLAALPDRLKGPGQKLPPVQEAQAILQDVLWLPQIAAAGHILRIPPALEAVAAVALFECRDVVAEMLSWSRRAAACYQVILDLDEPVRGLAEAWFRTHLPNWIEGEWVSVIEYMKFDLTPSLTAFKERQDSLPTPTAEILQAQTLTAITASVSLQPQFVDVDVAARLRGRLIVRDERDYNTNYAAHIVRDAAGSAAYNAYHYAQGVRSIASIDWKRGYFDAKLTLLSLRDRGCAVHHCVHESLHLLCSPAWFGSVGKCLNEGVTEYLARMVCDQSSIPIELNAYPRNVQLVKQLVAYADVTVPMLATAYLGGNAEPVLDAIERYSTPAGRRLLVERTTRTSAETVDLWFEELDRTDLDDLKDFVAPVFDKAKAVMDDCVIQ